MLSNGYSFKISFLECLGMTVYFVTLIFKRHQTKICLVPERTSGWFSWIQIKRIWTEIVFHRIQVIRFRSQAAIQFRIRVVRFRSDRLRRSEIVESFRSIVGCQIRIGSISSRIFGIASQGGFSVCRSFKFVFVVCPVFRRTLKKKKIENFFKKVFDKSLPGIRTSSIWMTV